MAQGVTELQDSTFQNEVLQSTAPVLVDFWAPWCAPCLKMAPIVEDFASDYQGRVRVAKINIDDNPESAQQYGVMSIPTLILYKGGKEVSRIVGAMPKSALASKVDPHL